MNPPGLRRLSNRSGSFWSLLAVFSGAAALSCLPGAARAETTYAWQGGGSSNNWTNGSNWINGSPPPTRDGLNTDIDFNSANFTGGTDYIYPNLDVKYDIYKLTFLGDKSFDLRSDSNQYLRIEHSIRQYSSAPQSFEHEVWLCDNNVQLIFSSNAGALNFNRGLFAVFDIFGSNYITSGTTNASFLQAGHSFAEVTGDGVFIQTGGEVNAGYVKLGDRYAPPNTIGGNDSTGVYSLRGGTLTTAYIRGAADTVADINSGLTNLFSATAALTLNGGFLRASADSDNFIDGLTRFSIREGGARINTNGHNVTILLGMNNDINGTDGGLSKLGAGTLTLAAANNFNGGVSLDAGTLTVGNAGALGSSGPIYFNGATLQYGTGINADFSSRFASIANQLFRVDTNGNTVTLGSGIGSNGGSLTKLGAGTLALSGANTFTGNTTISAGTLRLANTNALQNSTLVTSSAGGALSFAASINDFHLGGLSGNGSLTLTDAASARATLLVGANGASTTYSGALSGVGGLTKEGTGTLSLSGANAYSDATRVNGGTLLMTGGSLSASNAYVAEGGSGNFTQTGGTHAIGGGGQLFIGVNGGQSGTYTLSGSGALTTPSTDVGDAGVGAFNQLGGTHTTGSLDLAYYGGSQGTYYLSGGTLAANTVSGGSGASAFDFNGGILQARSGSNVFFQGLSAANVQAGGAKIDTNSFNVTIAQALLHDPALGGTADGGLTKSGAGTLTLTGVNTFTGNTSVSAGTLAIKGGGAVVLASARDFGVDGGAAAVLSDEGSRLAAGNTYVGTSGNGAFVQNGGSHQINSASGQLFLGYYTGGRGAYTLNGGALSAPSVDVGVSGRGTFTQTGGTNTVAVSLDIGFEPRGSGAYSLAEGALAAASANVGYYGSGAFTQTGGAHTLSGALGLAVEADSGGVYHLQGGTLRVGRVEGGAGSSTFNFDGGTLQAGGNSAAFFEGLGRANVREGGARIDTNGFDVTITQPLLHSNIEDDPAADGGLTKSGAGALTLTGKNSYTGGTNVRAGHLVALNNGNALSSGAVSIAFGAKLKLSNTDPALSFLQAGATTFSGAGTLRKTGAGVVQFGGNGGDVNVSLSAGALIDVRAGLLAGSSSFNGKYTDNQASLNIAAGATFNGLEADVRVDALTGAGTLQGGYLSGGSVTVGVANGTGVFSGAMADAGGGGSGGRLTFIKTGAGAQTLAGASTYTGLTTVAGGTLLVNNASGSGTGSGAVSVQGGARLGGTGAAAGRVVVNAGGTLLGGDGSAAAGGLTLGNALTLSSGATLQLALGAGGAHSSLARTGSGAWSFPGDLSFAVLDFGARPGVYDNIISGLSADPGTENTWVFADRRFQGLFTFDGANIDLAVTAVPEPATWLAGALAALLAAGKVRRRRP